MLTIKTNITVLVVTIVDRIIYSLSAASQLLLYRQISNHADKSYFSHNIIMYSISNP
jgi:hypothetical protein